MSFHSWKSVCLPKAAELWKQSLYWGREEIMQRINSLSHLENVCDNDIVCFYLTVKKTPPKQNKTLKTCKISGPNQYYSNAV